LFDEQRLQQLKPGTWLINAARGPVVDNAALLEALLQREDLQAVLDVWEAEPAVDEALADLCVLATPHIAGYSLDGKQRGTAQIYQAYCAFTGQAQSMQLSEILPAPWLSHVTLHADTDPAWALAMLCRGVYDPRRDDADFRRSLIGSPAEQRAAFDVLRKQYPSRREIDSLQVRIEGDSPALRKIVTALGATIV
jgi:erythronate-4-phosphate dehydrogenase